MFRALKEKYLKHTYLYDRYRLLRYEPFHRAYSFWAEDVLVDKALRSIERGTYVDVGCNHPIRGSMTYRLHRRGWSGVNVDFDEKNIRLFQKHRPEDMSFCCPIASDERDVECYSFDAGNVLNTLDRAAADMWAGRMNKPYRVECRRTRTLGAILHEAGVEAVDFLNIDVEGLEDEVLKGVDLDPLAAKLIACEIHIEDADGLDQSWAFRHLTGSGYRLISKIGPTCMFRRSDAKDVSY